MQVIALKRGYFGRRLIEAGEAFEAPEDTRASWFAAHNPSVPAQSAAGRSAPPDKARRGRALGAITRAERLARGRA